MDERLGREFRAAIQLLIQPGRHTLLVRVRTQLGFLLAVSRGVQCNEKSNPPLVVGLYRSQMQAERSAFFEELAQETSSSGLHSLMAAWTSTDIAWREQSNGYHGACLSASADDPVGPAFGDPWGEEEPSRCKCFRSAEES